MAQGEGGSLRWVGWWAYPDGIRRPCCKVGAGGSKENSPKESASKGFYGDEEAPVDKASLFTGGGLFGGASGGGSSSSSSSSSSSGDGGGVGSADPLPFEVTGLFAQARAALPLHNFVLAHHHFCSMWTQKVDVLCNAIEPAALTRSRKARGVKKGCKLKRS